MALVAIFFYVIVFCLLSIASGYSHLAAARYVVALAKLKEEC